MVPDSASLLYGSDTSIFYGFVLPEVKFYPGRISSFYRDEHPFMVAPHPLIIVALYRNKQEPI